MNSSLSARRFDPVGWKHESRIRSLFRAMDPSISDYTFPNLYLYRRRDGHRVIREEGQVFFTGIFPDGRSYVMPGSDPATVPMHLMIRCLETFGTLYPISEESLSLFPEAAFAVSHSEADTDYLYSTEGLAFLEGPERRRKRQKLRRFQSLYGHFAAPLTGENRDDALAVLKEWQDRQELPPDRTDYDFCREALEKMERLRLSGSLHFAGRTPAGFVLGEPLNRSTFLISFAKGKREFKGIYETMFSHTAFLHRDRYRYVNFAEDLGSEGLRRTKASYRPDGMIRKYRISLNVSSRFPERTAPP